jgi:spore germination cell wall hydrolase CwlJ-like protein
MTEKTIVALRRADRAVAGALLILVTFCVATAVASYDPHAEKHVARLAVVVPPAMIQTKLIAASQSVLAPPSAAELAMVRLFVLQQHCLAEAMYYEARGEGVEGQKAIAEVVFHRMRARGYPRSICGVVYQGAHFQRGCQFSFACDGELDQRKSAGAWARSYSLAGRIMVGIVHLGDITGNAISFHAVDAQPDWADRLERTTQIGNHVFYRALPRTKPS